MGKKLIKDSPIRKSVVGNFITETPKKEDVTESRYTVKTARRQDGKTVKLTARIPEEIDLLLEDIARKRRQETGERLSKKALIIEAIKLLAEKEGISQ